MCNLSHNIIIMYIYINSVFGTNFKKLFWAGSVNIFQLKDEQFSDYLTLMRERDARYTLYFENLGLHMKLKELDGSSYTVDDAYGDPVILRIALDRCR